MQSGPIAEPLSSTLFHHIALNSFRSNGSGTTRYSTTCTPFQNATRFLISAAAGFGSG
jgi:hypothetical protein